MVQHLKILDASVDIDEPSTTHRYRFMPVTLCSNSPM